MLRILIMTSEKIRYFYTNGFMWSRQRDPKISGVPEYIEK